MVVQVFLWGKHFLWDSNDYMDLDSRDLIGQNEGMIMTVSTVDVGPSHHFFDKVIECEMQLNLYDVNYFEMNEQNHFFEFHFFHQPTQLIYVNFP